MGIDRFQAIQHAYARRWVRILSLIWTLVFGAFFSAQTLASDYIRVVFSDNYAPLSWGEQDKVGGILVDTLDEVLRHRLKQRMQYEGYPWVRAQKLVQLGDADAFVTVPTAARLEYTTCSKEPVIIVNVALYTYADHPKMEQLKAVRSYADLADFQIIEYAGNGWAKEKFKDLNVSWVPGLENTYSMLAKKRGDVLVRNAFNFDYFSRNLDIGDKIVRLPVNLSSVKFHLCMRTSSQPDELLKRFDEEMAALRESGELDWIYGNYRQK